MNKKISAPIAIGIILILAVLLGGITLWQYSGMQKEQQIPLSEINISEKKECSRENDCILRDTIVNAPCSPCDISSSEYQCVSKEEAQKIQEEQSEKYGTSPCSPCPPEEISDKSFKCLCEENKCVKVEDETADWKTYTNEVYGFEVKYPESLLLYNTFISSVEYNSDGKNYIGVRLGPFNNGCSLNIFKSNKKENINPFDETDVSVTMMQYVASAIKQIETDNNIYHLGMSVISHAVSPEECKSLFDKILPTFKFLK